jgi:HEPN domain-containing protein
VTDAAPLDEEEFRRWRDEADRALAGARLQADAGLHNWACFAAEQGAQLTVKALLHGVGRAPWGHDLVRFGQAIADAGIDLPESVAGALRRLSRHYIPARYPDAHPSGSPGAHYAAPDADEAIADAAEVAGFVDGVWGSLRG